MAERAFWNEQIEKMPVDQLKALQLERLKSIVKKVFDSSEFYRSFYGETGIKPAAIKSLEDIQKLPFLDLKKSAKSNYLGMITSQKNQLCELHEIATDGIPLWLSITKKDIAYWADLNARQLWMVGLRPGDVLQNSYSYGLHTAAFGFHYGATLVGLMIIPIGVGQTERQIDTIKNFNVDAICMTPSYALYLSKKASDRGVKLSKYKLKLGLFGAEPFPKEFRSNLEKAFDIKAFSVFGMTEFLGPGMSCECPQRNGMHTWADAFLVECVDPKSGQWVGDGKEGEIVWTWLASDGTALIRYRSRNIASLTWEECECGRTHPRIGEIIGRTDEGVAVSGLVVYPKQFNEAIKNIPELSEKFQVVIERKHGLDKVLVKAEVTDQEVLKSKSKVVELEEAIRRSVKYHTEIRAHDIELLKPETLSKNGEKLKGIEDKRVLA